MERQRSVGLGFLSPRDGTAAVGARLLSGVTAGVSGMSAQTGKTLKRFYRGFSSALKREKGPRANEWYNPERQAAQKREWLENRLLQEKALGWPEHCFEHLVIVGLSPTCNIEEIVADLIKEQSKKKLGTVPPPGLHREWHAPDKSTHHAPPSPSYAPELLYKFPEDKPLHMSGDQLASFCFPHGVTPTLLARTPSMSALNEVIYGQQHLVHNEDSFVFMQKGGDDLPVFGVCYYVPQMVHAPPALAKELFPGMQAPITKHLVAAHRCYCLLSRYPFFSLHFQVLNVVLGFERLETISDFMQEVVALPPKSSLSRRLGFTTPPFTPSPSVTPEPQWTDLQEPMLQLGGEHRPFSASPSLSSLSARVTGAPCFSISAPSSWRGLGDGLCSDSMSAVCSYDLGTRSLETEDLKQKEQNNDQEQQGNVGRVTSSGTLGSGASVQDSCSSFPCLQRVRSHESAGCSASSLARRAFNNTAVLEACARVEDSAGGVGAQRSSISENPGRGADHGECSSGAAGSMSPMSKSSTGQNNADIGLSPFSVLQNREFTFSSGGINDFVSEGAESPWINNGRLVGNTREGREPQIMPDTESATSGSLFQIHEQKEQSAVGLRWGHARSVSGQSLHGFDDMENTQEASTSGRMVQFSEQPGRGTFNRGDSAFHSPLPQCYSLPPPDALEMSFSQWPVHSGANELYVGTAGALQLPCGRCVHPSSPKMQDSSLASPATAQVYRSPSAGDVLSAILQKNWRGQNTADNETGRVQLSPTLRVLMAYYFSRVPLAGEQFTFMPDDGLQMIEYVRPKVKPLGGCRLHPEDEDAGQLESCRLSAQISLIEAETAVNLHVWTIATVCKSLSLDNILSLLAALMLERRVVFFSPNAGILTACVLSVVPLLRPYVWQSLIMPVVPSTLLELLDAPVPFAVGLQYKTADVVQKCADLVRINLYKDGVKNAPQPSALPNWKQLQARLAPWHHKLQAFKGYSRRPVHFVTPGEEEAAEGFLTVVRKYLQELCGDIRRHTITEVGPAGRVSLLLEDSLVASFPQKDVQFMRAFVQTQMFSSFVDALMS